MRKKRAKNPKLAADGKPQEMFQDVKRACHAWLLKNSLEYRIDRIHVEGWMKLHGITNPNQSTKDTSLSEKPCREHRTSWKMGGISKRKIETRAGTRSVGTTGGVAGHTTAHITIRKATTD